MPRRPSVKRRVENGVRWLDENFPGWVRRINADTLDLTAGTECICGQVFAGEAKRAGGDSGYDYALENLFPEANAWISEFVKAEVIPVRRLRAIRKKAYRGGYYGLTDVERDSLALAADRAGDVAANLGFDSFGDDEDICWDALQREWKKVVKRLQSADAS